MHTHKSILAALLILFALAAVPLRAAPAPPIPPSPASQRTAWLGNAVYYLSPRFVLTARNIKTHRLLWTRRYDPKRFFYHRWMTAEPYQLSILLDHRTLYAGDRFGMTAYKPANGAQIWRGSYRSGVDGPPTIKERVIVNSFQSDGAISTEAVEATDARTGRYLWTSVGVFSRGQPVDRRGYLLYELDPFAGSGLKMGQKRLINIHTGKRVLL